MSKNLIEFQNVFDSIIRIQMLASLSISPMTFKQLKKICKCADGSLSHHVDKLMKANYVTMDKIQKNEANLQEINSNLKDSFYHQQVTVYKITDLGRDEYTEFVKTVVSEFEKQTEKEKENYYEENFSGSN